MKILTYSPSVEAYVEVSGKDGVKTYYDLSPDITSARVTRNSDTYSSFDITLQNKNGKYNGIFTPMDKVAIYSTKSERHRLLTGYITSVDKFTLYPSDFKLSGKCTFYQLMQLYWDPALSGSWQLLANERSESADWSGYGNVIWKLLKAVGGWDVDRVKIGEIPQEVIDWAYRMYQAKQTDIEQARDMVNEFYDVLRTSGPQFVGGASGGTTPGYNGTASSEAVEAAVKWMLEVANDDSHGYSQPNRFYNPDIDCSSFIYYALLNNGWTADQLGGTYPFVTWNMEEILSKCGWTGYAYDGDPSKLKRGDIMLNPETHVEMYIGGNQTVGAHSDYDGRTGDGSGNEVSVVTMATNWQRYLRYTG